MPYGKGKNYKGRARQFTNVEELKTQQANEMKWREKKNVSSSEEDSSDEDVKNEPLIQTNNPNYVSNKVKKISSLVDAGDEVKPEMSRRQREEINRQEATRRYQQLHAQGKTDEARADLARLAIIRKEREAAAEKRRLAKQEQEDRQKAAKEASLSAIKTNRGGGRNRKK